MSERGRLLRLPQLAAIKLAVGSEVCRPFRAQFFFRAFGATVPLSPFQGLFFFRAFSADALDSGALCDPLSPFQSSILLSHLRR